MSSVTNSDEAGGVLVAWYGDDFTGAAAVLEVLAFAGMPSLLFLAPPTGEQLARHPGLRCIGVASTARAQSPEWMADHLPQAFGALAALKPGVLHYKVCSTLDSAPHVGSIGKAAEIGADVTGAQVVPVMVAAPAMQRYQCFGHLFAGTGAGVTRLDRHPVMEHHPVTPMTEADVARHICLQSERLEGHSLHFPALKGGEAAMPDPPEQGRIALVTLDSIDDDTDAEGGRLIWEGRRARPFVIGSQGVEYALVAHWRRAGVLEAVTEPAGIGRAEGMVTVSGSVSPTTADQIAWACANGFEGIAFDASAVVGGTEQEVARVICAAAAALSQGRDPLIYSAAGPDDPAVPRFRAAVSAAGLGAEEANRRVGAALGQVLVRVLEQTGVRRAVVSGGDTSGFATGLLGIYALSALAPTIPGASIFRAHATGRMDGLELALKGGQMGSPDYFGWVRDGGGAR